MSDKHLGRVENSGDSGKQQFAQPWTAQMMTPKLDLSGASTQIPNEFGNLQLVDNSHTRQLQGSAQVRHEVEPTRYHSAYDNYETPVQHHSSLHAGTSDGSAAAHRHPHQQAHKTEYLVGQTTVPALSTPEGYHPSERITTTLPATSYREGERFNQVLTIPHERGKSNYYNGLANAHYEHNHLYGVPVHMERGQVTAYLDHEVDIPLHQKK